MELKNKKLANDEFYGMQKEILAQWPTGADVDFDKAVEFHKSLPERKIFGQKLIKAKKKAKHWFSQEQALPWCRITLSF